MEIRVRSNDEDLMQRLVARLKAMDGVEVEIVDEPLSGADREAALSYLAGDDGAINLQAVEEQEQPQQTQREAAIDFLRDVRRKNRGEETNAERQRREAIRYLQGRK